MSITIDGTKDNEKIFKVNDKESKVRIIPSLYLRDTEITASGGGSTDPGDEERVGEFKTCGIYPASSYADYDKLKVNVSSWETVENIPDNYYEINSNDEYYVSQFAGYAGIVVTKAPEPEPATWEDVTSEFLPSANPDWAEVKNVPNTTDATDIQVIFKKELDYNNYDYEIIFHPSILITSYTRVDIQHVEYAPDGTATSFADESNSISVQVSTVPAPGNTAGINSMRKVLLRGDGEQIAGITLQVNVSMTDEKILNMRFIVKEDKASTYPSSYTYNINSGNIESIKRKTKVSTLSLRSTSAVISQPDVIENLVVNNDALIQGNLFVNGYINDLSWYWDSIVINAIETDLGTGFLAKITDLTFKLNNEQVLVPTLQLSPGSSYKESSCSILWMPTGVLKIDANNITDILGSIQVLRYE